MMGHAAALSFVSGVTVMAPVAAPSWLRRPEGQAFFRIRRQGGRRQMFFVPSLVLKIARGHHGALLLREARNAVAAGRNPFWSDLAVRSFRVGPHATVSRRHGQVQPADHDAIADLVERRFAAALGLPRGPALALVRGNDVFDALAPEARRRAEAALLPLALPVTGMHGDLHVFNFCRTSAAGFGLLDWEYYSEQGSFVVDYLEFYVSAGCFGGGLAWPEHLAQRDGPDASAERAAQRLGVDADALWLLYLLIKLDIVARQRGGFAGLPVAERTQFLGTVTAQIDRTRPRASTHWVKGAA